MEKYISYEKARDMLLEIVSVVEKEKVLLEESAGMVLAQDLIAVENVPAFDRSPYDGYAFRAADSRGASPENPVTLKIVEEIAAGDWPQQKVTEGTAAKILTGAPIPQGADAVVMYERTEFTKETVTITDTAESGENIIYAGEDVSAGKVLAECGTEVDSGLAGSLASQGVFYPLVYRCPRVGLISTGNEVVDSKEEIPKGKIRNTNRYSLASEVMKNGCEPVYLGLAEDSVEKIAEMITVGLQTCDTVLLTGGVSVGDYDLTPKAMEAAGVHVLVQGVDMKPGMACAYGEKNGKPVCGLSGNPASSITNFHAVVMPALRKLAGRKSCLPKEITVTLADDFKKKSRCTRLLRGVLDLEDGTVKMRLPKNQGNVVISSTIGCNVLAVVPAGSGSLPAGTVLKGFLTI